VAKRARNRGIEQKRTDRTQGTTERYGHRRLHPKALRPPSGEACIICVDRRDRALRGERRFDDWRRLDRLAEKRPSVAVVMAVGVADIRGTSWPSIARNTLARVMAIWLASFSHTMASSCPGEPV